MILNRTVGALRLQQRSFSHWEKDRMRGNALKARDNAPHPVPLLSSSPWRAGIVRCPQSQANADGEGTKLHRLATAFSFLFTLAFFAGGPALAVDRRTPDWPCQQVKVPELSAAAVWPEPLPQNEEKAKEIPGLNGLAAELAARRTPMEEAEKKIASFITGTPEEKKEKAGLLFLGVFNALNSQRLQVMNGIERAYRKQKDFAEKIRTDTEKLRELQDANSDTPQLKELVSQVQWETRIFDDRRKTLKYACEVPVQIDQRIFALARAIQNAAGIG